jgi:hypothetical protein
MIRFQWLDDPLINFDLNHRMRDSEAILDTALPAPAWRLPPARHARPDATRVAVLTSPLTSARKLVVSTGRVAQHTQPDTAEPARLRSRLQPPVWLLTMRWMTATS